MRQESIQAGKIVGVHGIRGELKVQPLEGDAEFLAGFGTFLLEGKPVKAAACRVHKNQLLLKLPGVEDRTAAEALRGKLLYIGRTRSCRRANISTRNFWAWMCTTARRGSASGN